MGDKLLHILAEIMARPLLLVAVCIVLGASCSIVSYRWCSNYGGRYYFGFKDSGCILPPAGTQQ